MEEPTTPRQVLDQAREEFEKTIANKLAYIGDSGRKHLDKILSWHTSTLQSFVEAEIAGLEGKKRKYDDAGSGTFMPMTAERGDGYYNQALQDQITHLNQLLERLKL